MKKYKFWKGYKEITTVEQLRKSYFSNRINKYYNLWMSSLKWSGLDEEKEAEQENFIMRKAWSDGLIAVRQINNTDLLAFTTFTPCEFDMYDFPSKVNLINTRSVSTSIIPNTPQIVDKNVVIGWFQPSHKPIFYTVKHYVDLMIQVDMVINTNLALQNMPFLIGVSEEDQKKMQEVVQRILNNEVVVFSDLESLQKIQTFTTSTPFIIDKLREYLIKLEDELLSFLGIDNNGGIDKTNIVMDAVNSNNDLINQYKYSIKSEIDKWIKRVNKVFNRNIKVEDAIRPQVRSIHEDIQGKEVSEDETIDN